MATDESADPSTIIPTSDPSRAGLSNHATFQRGFDTPIHRKSATTLPFSTFSCYRHTTMNLMGDEMQPHVTGPMPVLNWQYRRPQYRRLQ
ncbi:hypothetical protein PAXINDRAFT_22348 [Paxillus involutus ATCC 200175]|uniref:Unplaced genomic scaffold PAXINscaffold_2577, whole genome shotgun sequence n=1 Tax=Paxillus involutus ATCC 200175 TaxID=664439 RepID=A0A0C9TAR8_PAXIN|nr:hypothetical protein PAXINDRAFT_22348 [Paxillus involutus ATCC 200175]